MTLTQHYKSLDACLYNILFRSVGATLH